jgi:CheY-like chemotaxis protein
MSVSVLVVEDDPATREALTLLLQSAGHTTAAVPGGREALAYLRSHGAPRPVLLDLMTPGLDGWTFLSERRFDPRLAAVPVVVFTAAGDLGRDSAWSLGAEGVVPKPPEPDVLLEVVGHYC